MDIQHHTPAQVRGYLRQCLAICEEEALTEQMGIAVMPTLLQLVSSKSVQLTQEQPVALPMMPNLRARQ